MTAYAAAEQLSPGALLRSADEPSSARLGPDRWAAWLTYPR